jgi:hypothetical protein
MGLSVNPIPNGMSAFKLSARQMSTMAGIGLVLLVAVGFLTFFGPPRARNAAEPVIAGKTLSTWLLDRNYPDQRAEAATNVIRQWGADSIPMLLDWLSLDERDYVQPQYQQRLNELLGRVKWVSLRFQPHPRPSRTSLAFQVLCQLGPEGKAAVPGLVRMLEDPNAGLRDLASRILAEIGPASVPALIQTLSKEDEAVKVMAAATLERIGAGARPAIPALRATLGLSPLSVRFAAARALVACGDNPHQVISVLLEAVRAGEPEMRASAYRALGSLGPRAQSAVPTLVEMLTNVPVSQIRFDTYWTVKAIDRAELIRVVAHTTNKALRSEVVAKLRLFDPDTAEQIEAQARPATPAPPF